MIFAGWWRGESKQIYSNLRSGLRGHAKKNREKMKRFLVSLSLFFLFFAPAQRPDHRLNLCTNINQPQLFWVLLYNNSVTATNWVIFPFWTSQLSFDCEILFIALTTQITHFTYVQCFTVHYSYKFESFKVNPFLVCSCSNTKSLYIQSTRKKDKNGTEQANIYGIYSKPLGPVPQKLISTNSGLEVDPPLDYVSPRDRPRQQIME